jgi:hypothetical protein
MPETPETTMNPEDVPSELAVMLGEALYDDAHEHCGEDGCYGGDRASYIKQARFLLADLLPVRDAEIEQRVRAKVAEEIEARRCDFNACHACTCRREDAVVARGEQP